MFPRDSIESRCPQIESRTIPKLETHQINQIRPEQNCIQNEAKPQKSIQSMKLEITTNWHAFTNGNALNWTMSSVGWMVLKQLVCRNHSQPQTNQAIPVGSMKINSLRNVHMKTAKFRGLCCEASKKIY